MQYRKHIRFDWAIKRLLRQKANFGILEGFLSELLNEDIHILEILESESNQATEQDKYNRVDILVKDQKGELIIIEIQNSYALDYFLRILYGISKAIVEHIKEGDTYAKVKKVISVNIVYFELGQGEDYLYRGTTNFIGIHDQQPLQLTAAQRNLFQKEQIAEVYPEIYLIKVNKFDDNAKNTLDEWIYFLKNSEIKQEFSAKGIKEADQVLKRANMSETERREYQSFVEVLSDRASIAMTIEFESKLLAEKIAEEAVEKAVEEAVEKAVEEAVEKAVEEAVEKAVDEAVEETVQSAIERMLKNTDLSMEQIAEIQGVSFELVAQIKAKLS
ncbi:MAG: Rpn family recombination-promoting nuclease/putative transposase [Bacteroidota bacterium]